ncbi:MAG: TRAP transporter large permease subunit, partial [Eggerthellaceae bacterium]|nr:TRAP transporter large permease subunit [Eggerthellaceae bacterium]
MPDKPSKPLVGGLSDKLMTPALALGGLLTAVAFVLAFTTAFGRVLSLTKATSAVTNFLTTNFHSSWSVLTVLVIIFLLLGMVMDTGPAIIILAP